MASTKDTHGGLTYNPASSSNTRYQAGASTSAGPKPMQETTQAHNRDPSKQDQDIHDLEKASTDDQVVTAKDWNEPDDPENPMNWSMLSRALRMVPIAFLAFAVTAGSSMITPATSEIAEHFNVSREAAILSLCLFVLGLGIGPVIAAPVSEMYGRLVVYRATAFVYMLFILGAGFTDSFAGLLICRFLAGAAGGPVLAVGSGTMADMFPTHIRAIPSSFFIMAPFLGPALGPVIGGFAAQFQGYRWTQWCTIFLALAAFVMLIPAKETYKKAILTRRAKRLGIDGPASPASTRSAMVKRLVTITLARPMVMLVTEPIVLFSSLYVSFIFSVLFAFFGAFPYTFTKVYGFNTWQNGLTFLGIGVGNAVGLVIYIVIDRRVHGRMYREQVKEGKTFIAPENRLFGAMIGAFGVPIGLFWFAWTARPSIHWISPILAGIPFALGNLLIFLSTVNYLIDVYGPLNGASAMAANGFARYTMAAVFPLFTLQMYQTLGIDWATSLLGFISLAMMPIPFVFYKFGPRIREKSRYDTVKE